MVTLIVFLATGEPVISEAPVSWQQCHKVVQALEIHLKRCGA